MRQVIKKSFLDWTRSKGPKIQARGVAAVAMFSQKVDAVGNIQTSGTTRCVWSDMQSRSTSRYLTRKVWTN